MPPLGAPTCRRCSGPAPPYHWTSSRPASPSPPLDRLQPGGGALHRKVSVLRGQAEPAALTSSPGQGKSGTCRCGRRAAAPGRTQGPAPPGRPGGSSGGRSSAPAGGVVGGAVVRVAACAGSRRSSALRMCPAPLRRPRAQPRDCPAHTLGHYPVASRRKPSLIALRLSVGSLPVPPSACSPGTRPLEARQGPERDMACCLGYSVRGCLPPWGPPPRAEHLHMLQSEFVPLLLSLPWAQGGWVSGQSPLPCSLPPSTRQGPEGRGVG